ncbi:MAG: hypothetical protein U0T02_08475 [Solirubrobacteraceae bacterium]
MAPDAADDAAPRLPAILATLRRFAREAGAARVALVLDQGAALPAAVVDCPADGPVEIAEGGEVRVLGQPDALAGEPLGRVHVHALPPFEVDSGTGELRGILGGLDSYGRAVRELATLFPGRSAVTVEWETTDPAAPLSLAARGGDEPMALALGEAQFDLPEGFPAPGRGEAPGDAAA